MLENINKSVKKKKEGANYKLKLEKRTVTKENLLTTAKWLEIDNKMPEYMADQIQQVDQIQQKNTERTDKDNLKFDK